MNGDSEVILAVAVLLLVLGLLAFFFAGTPDIADAIRDRLMKGCSP